MIDKKDITILIATHKDDIFVPDIEFFKPIQVGAAGKSHFQNMLHDDTGINISKKNRAYGEMSAIYWAWKNLKSDYYGLFHYRRYMSFSNKRFPIVNKSFVFGEIYDINLCDSQTQDKYCFDDGIIYETIIKHDFLATEPTASLDGATAYAQYEYAFGHHIEDLDCALNIIKSRFPEIYDSADEYMHGKKIYTCNMFVMKRDIFNNYCRFIFSVLVEFENKRDLSLYSDIDNRVLGYLAERLTGIYIFYLYKKGFSGKNLQRVYFENATDVPINVNETETKPQKTKNKITLRSIGKNIATYERSLKSELKKIYRKFHKENIAESALKSFYHPEYCNSDELSVFYEIKDCLTMNNGFVGVNILITVLCDDSFQANNIFFNKSKCGNNIVGDVTVIESSLDHVYGNDSLLIIKTINYLTLSSIDGLDICINFGDKDFPIKIDEQEIKDKLNNRAIITQNSSQRSDYNEWIKTKILKESELKIQRFTKFEYMPLYSIVVPLFNTDLRYLKDMLNSVVNQTYYKFEVILVNSSPENIELKNAVETFAALESRIKVIELSSNLGITENTNIGIDNALGDFICFLDHDDTLEPNALYEYTVALNQNINIDLIYCDEDKLLNGKYVDPYFKPDFNWDLLFGINYVCHFLCCRTSIVKSIERPKSMYDGAQDHNMTLCVAEKARSIYHVPKILYHWRIHKNSTASDPEKKNYTLEAARLSVQHYFDRNKIPAEVVNSLKIPRHYDVNYILPDKIPLISIVIPSKDHVDILEKCINSIYMRTSYTNFEVIVVDNHSTDLKAKKYYTTLQKQHKNFRFIEDKGSFNFSRIVNNGVKATRGKFVLLLNNDTEVITDNWLEKMVGPLLYRCNVGIVGAKLLFKDNTVQHAGVVITERGPVSTNYRLGRYDSGYYNTAILPMNVSCVTGACMLFKRALFDNLGGFDEEFATNYNDIDFCLKARKSNYLVCLQSTVELYHYESLSREIEEMSKEGREKMKKAYAKLVFRYPDIFAEGDPYYNSNFGAGNYYRFE